MILQNLIRENKLQSSTFSATDKEKLYLLMEKYGASRGFTYDRFFKEGFRLWELVGVDFVKDFFLRSNQKKAVLDYLNVLRLNGGSGNGCFWTAIGEEWGLRASFKNFMALLGMLSDVTIQKRFFSDNWKEFERVGIVAIIRELEPSCDVSFDAEQMLEDVWQQSLSNRCVK